MMLDQDLDNLYKENIGTSHYAALRAVWDSGYNYALSQTPAIPTQDPSLLASNTTAIADTPTALPTV